MRAAWPGNVAAVALAGEVAHILHHDVEADARLSVALDLVEDAHWMTQVGAGGRGGRGTVHAALQSPRNQPRPPPPCPCPCDTELRSGCARSLTPSTLCR